jgi:hypothetical protein
MNLVLLLTASVDPRGCAFTARADPALRLDDYRRALDRWLSSRLFTRIVWCENSTWNLEDLAPQRQAATAAGIELELLGFDGQDYDRRLGKGYGELGIIAHALDQSRLIAAADRVIKVTGRYFVRNAAPLVRRLQRAAPDLICDLRLNLTVGDARIFAASPACLREDLLPLRPLANDAEGCYFEHLLARAAHLAMGRGRTWELLPMSPRIDGVGGSLDEPMRNSLSKPLRHALKRWLLRY